VDIARPRLSIPSTREARAAIRENIKSYYRVMVASALALQLSQGKMDERLSSEAFATMSQYMASEYAEITPDNIDRLFEDTTAYVALGLLAGEYSAASEAGRRALDAFARFKGPPWIECAGSGCARAPGEIAGVVMTTSLAAIMSGDLAEFRALGSDAVRGVMLKDQCRSLFTLADNPAATGGPMSLFMTGRRQAFMGAVLKIVRQLKSGDSPADAAAVSCGSNLAAFFARIGDMETALSIYGELSAVALPTFDLDPAIKHDVLPRLVGVVENPVVKGEAICALGDMYAADGDLGKAGAMYGTAFKLMRDGGQAARSVCWLRSACTLGALYIRQGKPSDAIVILQGAQDAAKAEKSFPREKCALAGVAAANNLLGKTRQFRSALTELIAVTPDRTDFGYMLVLLPKKEARKAVMDEAAKNPAALPELLRGMLISGDPPDQWTMGEIKKRLDKLDDEGRFLFRLKSAKLDFKGNRDKEGTDAMLAYLREIPQKRFKPEFLSAMTWLDANGKQKAITEISNALAEVFMLDSGDFLHLGDVMFQSARFAPAAYFYGKAKAKMPGSYEPCIKLARAKLMQGDIPGSLEQYREAGRYGTLTRADIINVANALVAQKLYDDAHAFLDAEIKANESFDDAHFTKGVIHSIQNKCNEAMASYTRAIQINPGNMPALTAMGYAQLDCKDLNAAQRSFEGALGGSTDRMVHFDANLGLAIASMRRGDDASAITSFRKALLLNPKLSGGADALIKEGYVYTPPQAADINKLLDKYNERQ
jgi:tetratricopeptide (TPR) repeat protein